MRRNNQMGRPECLTGVFTMRSSDRPNPFEPPSRAFASMAGWSLREIASLWVEPFLDVGCISVGRVTLL